MKKKPSPVRLSAVELNLLSIGEQMSNVFFNLGQNNGPLAKWKDLQVQLDAAKHDLLAVAPASGRMGK